MSARRAAPSGDPVNTLHYCMRQVTTLGASDLHLKTDQVPYLRLNGELTPIPGMYALDAESISVMVRELTRHVPDRLLEFDQSGETDISYELRSCARFRINIFRQRGEVSVALRVIPNQVPTLESLNLPPIIETLATVPRGLVLVTGATGSGKTTTLAAMIDHINRTSARHIVTVEDPIEIVHEDRNSLINQREIGADTGSFSGALRRALRQDPDVILIGEMRDEETVRAALSAAETGHLVFSTLHTIDVMETIYRVLDFFPAELERQARAMLSGTLRGIISQRLLRTTDGRSRVPAVEVLVGTSRISDAILNADETGTILDAVGEGGYYGMQTFDQCLLQLVLDRAVTVEEAMSHATSKQNFALLLEANEVVIDTTLRRSAAGSRTALDPSGPGIDGIASARRAARNVPPPIPTAAQPPTGPDVLPSIAGATDPTLRTYVPYVPQEQDGAAPRQPRPQPGITPDLPGHAA